MKSLTYSYCCPQLYGFRPLGVMSLVSQGQFQAKLSFEHNVVI